MIENGLLCHSGRWYPCNRGEHIQTLAKNHLDAPFIFCNRDEFSALIIPTRKQFETVMDFCIRRGLLFEDVIIGPEWSKWVVYQVTNDRYL